MSAQNRGWVVVDVGPDAARVAVDMHATHGEPVAIQLDTSAPSDVLGLGRHHHLLLGSPMGPAVRTVLDHSCCPMSVIPDGHRPTGDETSAVADVVAPAF